MSDHCWAEKTRTGDRLALRESLGALNRRCRPPQPDGGCCRFGKPSRPCLGVSGGDADGSVGWWTIDRRRHSTWSGTSHPKGAPVQCGGGGVWKLGGLGARKLTGDVKRLALGTFAAGSVKRHRRSGRCADRPSECPSTLRSSKWVCEESPTASQAVGQTYSLVATGRPGQAVAGLKSAFPDSVDSSGAMIGAAP